MIQSNQMREQNTMSICCLIITYHTAQTPATAREYDVRSGGDKCQVQRS